MGSYAEPARVGETLAVDDKYIGMIFKFFDDFKANGRFAKRKKAWNVGECEFFDGMLGFNYLQLGQGQYNGGGNDFFVIFGKSTIEACNEFGAIFDGGKANFTSKVFLKLDGL